VKILSWKPYFELYHGIANLGSDKNEWLFFSYNWPGVSSGFFCYHKFTEINAKKKQRFNTFLHVKFYFIIKPEKYSLLLRKK